MDLLKRLSLSLLFVLAGMRIDAQTGDWSAVLIVLAEDVVVQRAQTTMKLPLKAGSVAPVGAGDQVLTGANGRVYLLFPDANRLYLLPESRYELLEFSASGEGEFRLEGRLLNGIAIQQFEQDRQRWVYRLETEALTILEPSQLFAVWAVKDRLEAVISASGALIVQKPDSSDTIRIPQGAGLFATLSDTPIELEPPYHAAQLMAKSINCQGTVSTGGGEGLRLRRGAALDYQIVDVLQDGQSVLITGITENERWYRIPFQTGFGWLFRSLVRADCQDLPRFPNLVGEANEQISRVTPGELELLEPFFGSPRTNPVFFR